jgi:hypothetical protein
MFVTQFPVCGNYLARESFLAVAAQSFVGG